jgi:aspartate/methionine/tyrosine aminotransferase
VVTAGGLRALFNVLLCTVDPGDEVIVTDPTYAGIVNRIRLAGGVPRFVPFLADENGWRFDRVRLADVTMPVAISRFAATAILRGDQGHVAVCVAELERRRDTILSSLPGWPFVSPAGGWSLLLDVASLGFEPAEASRILLDDAKIAATAMTGWGDQVAAKYVRFVFSAEPVDRLQTIRDRVDGTKLAEAVANRD